MRANARRLVDRELLGHGEVQGQVEERIRFAALGTEIAIGVTLGRLEDRVVLRMERDQVAGHLLERRQRTACLALRPRVDQEAPGFIAGRREHRWLAYAVLWRYSQRSRITHSAHLGARATHT